MLQLFLFLSYYFTVVVSSHMKENAEEIDAPKELGDSVDFNGKSSGHCRMIIACIKRPKNVIKISQAIFELA